MDIVFVDTTIEATKVLEYVDSVLTKDTTAYSVSESLSEIELSRKDRIIHFKNNPEESYHISCDAKPCWIKSIYNMRIDSTNWLYSRKKVDDEEIKRIEQRFRTEVLNSVRSGQERPVK